MCCCSRYPAKSGAFRKLCQRLAGEHLNIDYAYGSLTSSGGSKVWALAVIKANDLAKAWRVLAESGSNNGGRSARNRPGRRPSYAR